MVASSTNCEARASCTSVGTLPALVAIFCGPRRAPHALACRGLDRKLIADTRPVSQSDLVRPASGRYDNWNYHATSDGRNERVALPASVAGSGIGAGFTVADTVEAGVSGLEESRGAGKALAALPDSGRIADAHVLR